MKLLLDTPIWLWSHLEPERLARKVRPALEDPVNELWLSPVTTWEVMTLASAGRVVLTPDAADWIRHAPAAAPAFEAPFSHDIVLAN